MATTRTLTRTLLFAGIAAALAPSISSAQDTLNQGYLVASDTSIVTSGAGLCWHTSDWTPERAVAPCDPVKAEAAAPKLADATPAPEKMLPHKITLSADALFDFNKSALHPQGKARLDDLARELNDAQYDTVLVTGHTDRIGSAAYNQKLSLRRADAVKAYLVSKGVPANRISTNGMGETQPVTQPGDCKGPKSNKLITCLQPDRRVEVTVTGTKEK